MRREDGSAQQDESTDRDRKPKRAWDRVTPKRRRDTRTLSNKDERDLRAKSHGLPEPLVGSSWRIAVQLTVPPEVVPRWWWEKWGHR